MDFGQATIPAAWASAPPTPPAPFATRWSPGSTGAGGVGGAFRAVFDWIAGANIQPVCAVYLTDLYASYFGPAPEYAVLWISTGATAAPFGEVIPTGESNGGIERSQQFRSKGDLAL